MLLHHKLLFVDEFGSNTSQAKDGHCGGEKVLVPTKLQLQIYSTTKDSHFTVLGFTAASSEPVMCTITFAVKDLDPAWVMGLDPFCLWAAHDDDIEENMGKGKQYPVGPECEFEGKQYPVGPECEFEGKHIHTFFCCCSENGSITSELLKETFMNIDKHEAFDRSDGIPLFLLLDGHGSQFQLDFFALMRVTSGMLCWSTLWHIILASWQQCRAKWLIQNCIVMGEDSST